jgi:S1-C subfamily serine protease
LSALVSLSDDIATAVAQASGAVVAVDARRRSTSSGVHWREGIVVTADHTVKRDAEIELTLPDGRCVPAELVGRDPGVDLTVLRFEGAGLRTADFAPPDDLAVGQIAIAIARSDDDGVAATMGVISALGGPWRTWQGGRVERLIRPDLTLYSGFSGGPLVDGRGRIIGINTSGLSRQTALTLPAATVDRTVHSLLTRGGTARGYLGVGMQQVRIPEDVRQKLKIENEEAVIILSVEPDGPASSAGLMLGDVLIALDGSAITDVHDVLAYLSDNAAGRKAKASLIRAGRVVEVEIAIGERPAEEAD